MNTGLVMGISWEQLIPFRHKKKEGFFDKTTGDVVIPPIYDGVRPFSEGRALFMRVENRCQKWGVLNESGDEVQPAFYELAKDYSEGLAAFSVGTIWHYIDLDGNTVFSVPAYFAHPFSGGLARINNLNGQWGYIGRDGGVRIACKYNFAEDFSDGFALVMNDGNRGYLINREGETFMNDRKYYYDSFSEGLAALCEHGIEESDFITVYHGSKFGYMDVNGAMVIPFYPYEEASFFSEGRAKVRKDLLYGFINRAGQLVVPCEYHQAEPFHGGLSKVRKGGQYGFINRQGELVIPCEFRDANNCGRGVASVIFRGKELFFNERGERIKILV